MCEEGYSLTVASDWATFHTGKGADYSTEHSATCGPQNARHQVSTISLLAYSVWGVQFHKLHASGTSSILSLA